MTFIHHTAVLGQCRLRLVGPPAETAINREDGVKLANIETALRVAGKSLWKAARVVNGGAPLIMRTEAAAAAPVGGDRFLSTIEALRVITLREAARFNGLSIDSLRRHHSHLFVRTSTNRIGVGLIDALRIARPIESSPEAAERSEMRLPGG